MDKGNVFIFDNTLDVSSSDATQKDLNLGEVTDCCDDCKSMPLHHAAEYSQVNIVKPFLEKGATVNENNFIGQTPILIAAEHQHKNIVQTLLEWGADINYRSSDETTLLHFASFNGWLEIAQHLVTRGIELDSKNSSGETPIFLAAENSHKEIVELLLAWGADINYRSSDEQTLLHFASYNGWLEIAQHLVTKGIELDSKNSSGVTPIFLAAETSHKEIVQLLLNAGANFNRSSGETTLLHFACYNGWLEIAFHLLTRGLEELDSKNGLGETPILLAAENAHKEIVELLFNTGAKFDFCSSRKWTLLHHASEKGWIDIAQCLVKEGFDLNVKTNHEDVPLLLAAKNSHKGIVELLVNSGADVFNCDDDHWTLLHYACQYGWFKLAQSLIQMGFDVNFTTIHGTTPLVIATNKCYKDIVKLLVDCGADIEYYFGSKRTVLHVASELGWLEVVASLAKKKVDIDAKTSSGYTPILLAASNRWKDIVEMYIDLGADINHYVDKSLLHMASKNGWRKVVEALCEKGADINAENACGETPLLVAAKHKHKYIVERLICLGANINCFKKDDNITLLHCTTRYGWLEVVRSLVRKGADPNAKTSNGCTPLFYAVYSRHKDIFKLLINLCKNVNCCDDKNWTVLHHVAKEGWADGLELTVQKGADLNATTSDGKTPLLLAAEYSHEVLVRKLIDLGANVNCFDSENWTVLHYASREGWLNIVQSLVKEGSDPDVKTFYDYTPLLLAAEFKYSAIVELLSNLVENIDCCTKDKKWTTLHFASNYGWLEAVQTLVKRGADLNVKNSQGLTPLLIAAKFSRHEDIVKLLIDSKANLDCYDENNWTVLHYASRFGWLGTAQSIVKREAADLNSTTDFGDTPLLIAAKHHNLDIVLLLIHAGADFMLYNNCKWTLLRFALLNGWLDVIQSLANRGVDFNLKTSGKVPLLIAAKSSRRDCVEFLIERGVNVDCWDGRNRTVLHYASLYKWPRVVQAVVERGCDVNAKIPSGDTTIHLACRFTDIIITESSINACIEIVQFLMEKGVDINAKNCKGQTALVLASHFVFYKGNEYLLLKILKYLFGAGADCNVVAENGRTVFHNIARLHGAEAIKLFIKNGAYFSYMNCYTISENSSLTECVLQDIKFCSQAIINRFNNKDLPTLYKLDMLADILPPIEKMKIADNRGITQDIEQVQAVENTVRWEIQTKGYCNVLEASPMVLSILSVKSFINFYNKL